MYNIILRNGCDNIEQPILEEKSLDEKLQEMYSKTKWSYSRLDCYKQCKFKYKLKYVDKHYFYSGSIATEFGTAIHEAEEKIANSIQINRPIEYNKIKNEFILKCDKIKYKYYDEWFGENDDNYDSKFYYYLTSGIYRLENFVTDHPDIRVVGAEVPVNYSYKGKVFTGFIDRLLYDTRSCKYIIQDIKTWPSIEKHKDDLVTPMQFVVYSLALADMKECSVEMISCQYDLPFENNYFDAGTKGFIARGTKKMDELFDGIFSFDYEPSPKPLCAWCEFSVTNPNAPEEGKHLCPYHSIWDREIRDKKTCCIPANRWDGLEADKSISESYIKSFREEMNS